MENFFNQVSSIPNVKYAAIGKSTAKTLSQFVTPDFIGKGSPNNAANSFKGQIGDSIVLFPIAEGSLKSIQKQLDPTQIEELIVYRTLLKNSIIVKPKDVIIFTSPSNVRGYLLNTPLSGSEKVIAIGYSTYNALKEVGINAKIAFQPNELALIDEVRS